MRLLVKFQTPCAKNGASIRPGTKQAAQRWIAIQDQALRKLLVLFVILTGLFVGESRAQANATGDTTIDTTTDTTGATSTMLGKTDSVTLAIGAVLQEMFWRVRANDNSVFYENEFPQLRESMNLDTYLQGVRFRRSRRPNSDSIIAITIDSARVTGDTAMAYVNLTILPPGSGAPGGRTPIVLLP